MHTPDSAAAACGTRRRNFSPWRQAALASTAVLALLASTVASAADCADIAGALACQDLGLFSARALRIQVTQKDQGPVAYRTARATLRLANTGEQPLMLAYRHGSLKISDNNGNAYGAGKATGIGTVSRQGVDTQFVLAPGQARELSLEAMLQYRSDKAVAGQVLSVELALVEMTPLSSTQVRHVRDHLLSFAALNTAAGQAGLGQAVVGQAGVGTGQPVEAAIRLIDALRKKH